MGRLCPSSDSGWVIVLTTITQATTMPGSAARYRKNVALADYSMIGGWENRSRSRVDGFVTAHQRAARQRARRYKGGGRSPPTTAGSDRLLLNAYRGAYARDAGMSPAPPHATVAP